MQYCPTMDCSRKASFLSNEGTYCNDCGIALTPLLACLCGKAWFNPKLPDKFCTHCGNAFTLDYLTQCMQAQLGGMVKEIAGKMAALN